MQSSFATMQSEEKVLSQFQAQLCDLLRIPQDTEILKDKDTEILKDKTA